MHLAIPISIQRSSFSQNLLSLIAKSIFPKTLNFKGYFKYFPSSKFKFSKLEFQFSSLNSEKSSLSESIFTKCQGFLKIDFYFSQKYFSSPNSRFSMWYHFQDLHFNHSKQTSCFQNVHFLKIHSTCLILCAFRN